VLLAKVSIRRLAPYILLRLASRRPCPRDHSGGPGDSRRRRPPRGRTCRTWSSPRGRAASHDGRTGCWRRVDSCWTGEGVKCHCRRIFWFPPSLPGSTATATDLGHGNDGISYIVKVKLEEILLFYISNLKTSDLVFYGRVDSIKD